MYLLHDSLKCISNSEELFPLWRHASLYAHMNTHVMECKEVCGFRGNLSAKHHTLSLRACAFINLKRFYILQKNCAYIQNAKTVLEMWTVLGRISNAYRVGRGSGVVCAGLIISHWPIRQIDRVQLYLTLLILMGFPHLSAYFQSIRNLVVDATTWAMAVHLFYFLFCFLNR